MVRGAFVLFRRSDRRLYSVFPQHTEQALSCGSASRWGSFTDPGSTSRRPSSTIVISIDKPHPRPRKSLS